MPRSHIVVPLDGSTLSESILPLARTMAQGINADLLLLNVSTWHPSYEPRIVAATGDFIPAERYLQELAEKVKGPGLAIATKVTKGDPAIEAQRLASEVGAVLIAIATHGASGPGRLALGSTTDRLVHVTTSPLLIRHPRKAEGLDADGVLQHVVVPLDGSPLGEAALAQAEALATALNLPLHLVQVAPTPATLLAGLDPYAGSFDPSIFDALQKAAAGYLAAKSAALTKRGLKVDSTVLVGSPAGQIIDYAESLPHSIIAMSTHGRSGVSRWVLGSVADRVVRASHSPVLLIRAKK